MNQASFAYQALVFVCQVAAFGALAAWWLRGTRPGRDVCKGIVWLAKWWPRRQQAARDQAALTRWNAWVSQLDYWSHQRRQYSPGTPGYELAQDSINALHRIRPPRPGSCPHTGFTCPDPTCMVHQRRRQS